MRGAYLDPARFRLPGDDVEPGGDAPSRGGGQRNVTRGSRAPGADRAREQLAVEAAVDPVPRTIADALASGEVGWTSGGARRGATLELSIGGSDDRPTAITMSSRPATSGPDGGRRSGG
jgi:hypothetical protein